MFLKKKVSSYLLPAATCKKICFLFQTPGLTVRVGIDWAHLACGLQLSRIWSESSKRLSEITLCHVERRCSWEFDSLHWSIATCSLLNQPCLSNTIQFLHKPNFSTVSVYLSYSTWQPTSHPFHQTGHFYIGSTNIGIYKRGFNRQAKLRQLSKQKTPHVALALRWWHINNLKPGLKNTPSSSTTRHPSMLDSPKSCLYSTHCDFLRSHTFFTSPFLRPEGLLCVSPSASKRLLEYTIHQAQSTVETAPNEAIHLRREQSLISSVYLLLWQNSLILFTKGSGCLSLSGFYERCKNICYRPVTLQFEPHDWLRLADNHMDARIQLSSVSPSVPKRSEQGAAGNVIVLQPTKTAMTFCDVDLGRRVNVPADFF